ncbi:polycystin-2-like protein 2 isoform X4 [Macrotis lagotis]|uniref:polycystin-2-like protein 2 isoform X4 n=1 Tax=Macrotis lagotis TaxID=92651 RepID=UPI003D688E00
MAKVKSPKGKRRHLEATVSLKPKLTYKKEVEIRSTLQELLIYIIFLTDLCILTFGMVSTNMYYLNKVMATLFLETSIPGKDRTNFKSISTITEFWKFMEGPLLEGLYWETWDTTEVLYQLKNSSRLYYENILLGVPRIRQLKVRNNTCIVYPKFQSLMDECFDRYTIKNEDRSDFGPRQVPEWKYSPSTSSLQHWGVFGVYDGGGYMFTLPVSKTEAKEKFTFLKLNSWITRGTRVIFVDFSTYNANVNLFCIIRLVAEFPATGGVLTSWNFYSVKLLRYVTLFDYFIASCEIIFCIFIINFFIQEIKKMKEYKYAYFKSFWNLLELLLLLLSILAISINIFRTSQAYHLLGHLLEKTQEYPDFYFLAYWQIRYNDMVAINIFFAWIKNMFLAIINDAYAEVKADYSIGRSPESELANQIKASYTRIMEKLKLKKPQTEDQNEAKEKDTAFQSRRDFDEKEIESANQMKKWKERLEQKYYSSEIPEAYQPVTQEEFRELFLFAVELEKELHYVSTKLNRVMRRISATKT